MSGEHNVPRVPLRRHYGSSPRERGAHPDPDTDEEHERIIPA